MLVTFDEELNPLPVTVRVGQVREGGRERERGGREGGREGEREGGREGGRLSWQAQVVTTTIESQLSAPAVTHTLSPHTPTGC